ncbi:MAG: hypothetical protein HY744_32840 [Deltaproteobacteria bacterium]|nr:hypothetical protein [Deltaproteobacteria bacterium]
MRPALLLLGTGSWGLLAGCGIVLGLANYSDAPGGAADAGEPVGGAGGADAGDGGPGGGSTVEGGGGGGSEGGGGGGSEGGTACTGSLSCHTAGGPCSVACSSSDQPKCSPGAWEWCTCGTAVFFDPPTSQEGSLQEVHFVGSGSCANVALSVDGSCLGTTGTLCTLPGCGMCTWDVTSYAQGKPTVPVVVWVQDTGAPCWKDDGGNIAVEATWQ